MLQNQTSYYSALYEFAHPTHFLYVCTHGSLSNLSCVLEVTWHRVFVLCSQHLLDCCKLAERNIFGTLYYQTLQLVELTHQIGKNNFVNSHGLIAFLCLNSGEVAIIWKSLGMILGTGWHHTLARTQWGPEQPISLPVPQLITARRSAVGPPPRAREDVSEGALTSVSSPGESCVTVLYDTGMGCHYVKWQ